MTSKPIENCYWVVPGKLLAGEYPRNYDEDSSPGKVAALTGAGVAAFIDLTAEGDRLPYVQWLGEATHQRFPIVDGSVPASHELTREILDAIDGHIAQDRMVYVHCMGGIGRTGTIIGCWLARHGTPGRDPLKELDSLWQSCPKSRAWNSPETWEQAEYVLGWSEGR